ncbi:MAG: CooT family nickel-binding protein [Dehalococcoidia bacterium]|nr:CooT family nickel-binding protein [Dehalococcoidia bacterium]
MCIATVYVGEAGRMETVMQDVISVELENHGILLTTILGEEKLLKGRIKNIDFLKHSVIVEKDTS